MVTADALVKRGRCPTDGTTLTGKTGWCRACRSNWYPLLEGTGSPDCKPLDSRDYIRRKLREIDSHRLAPTAPPAATLARRQGGTRQGTLFNPRKAYAFAEHLRGRSVDTPVLGRVFA